jgi:hypothetical protein
MLKGVISKANQILNDAQQNLTSQAADALGRVYISIENLNKFINKEINRIERDPKLSFRERSILRRGVLEQAGRKLEVLKDRNYYSDPTQESDIQTPDTHEKDDRVLLKFMREREIRDRLFGMTEAQILSHFGEALFDGRNQLLLNAILNAPPGFEMLSDQNIRKLRMIRAENLTKNIEAKPKADRTVKASIIEIFSLVKKELDRLRKDEIAVSRAENYLD